jgi:hypothetical protein
VTVGRVPSLVVHLVLLGQPVTEELLVVAVLQVVGLEPHPGNMEGVAVRGEPSVGLVDVRADVARAGDHVRGVDVQVSSIPGVPYPVYIAGSRITHMYPFGPLPGCAAMITLISHDGGCCIGINTDASAITDPAGSPTTSGQGWTR